MAGTNTMSGVELIRRGINADSNLVMADTDTTSGVELIRKGIGEGIAAGNIVSNGNDAERSVLPSDIMSNIRCRKARLGECQRRSATVSYSDPLVISFAGRFKTGKSSLINAILGQELLPTRATTATAVVTRIFKGRMQEAYLLENGVKKRVTMEQARDTILNYKVKNVEHPVEVIFQLPIPWLSQEIELRDTPGLDDSAQDGMLEEVTLRSLEDSDICVCVHDASAILGQRERDRMKKIHGMLGGNTVFVVNRIDTLNSEQNFQQVKATANSFFSGYRSSTPTMCKQYFTSSMPGNTALDGLDELLHLIAGNNGNCDLYRRQALAGHEADLRGVLLSESDADTELMKAKKKCLEKEHSKVLATKQKAIMDKAQKKADHVDAIMVSARDSFSEMDGLIGEIENRYSNNAYDDYASMCAEETEDFFRRRFQSIRLQYPEYAHVNPSFISSVVKNLSFPGTTSSTHEVETGNRALATALGAGFGTAIAPGLGTLIGGFLGGLFGGGTETVTVDTTISTTKTFIDDTVFAAMRREFIEMSGKVKKKIREDAEKKAQQCTSGYEQTLEEADKALKALAEEKMLYKGTAGK